MKFSKIPLWFIILNNLLPITGLLFFEWKVFNFFFFFWVESLIIIVIAYLKIFFAQKKRLKLKSWILLTAFIGVFLSSYALVLYGKTKMQLDKSIFWSILILITSNLTSYLISKKEDRVIDGEGQVGIILTKLVPIMLVLGFIGLGKYGIIFFLILKTTLDYSAYLKENKVVALN